ncbi:uncharacterized protein P886_2505 [Alteromonadaceae bacterium 2753L.S.0a.02]|nr:uncharacterized protein P886_2505 [Alteromonadaceae bacterium 2753L.S.0a.02]
MSATAQQSRINIVDALRGFALMGIVIAHMIEQYTASPRPEAAWWVSADIADKVVLTLQFLLVTGKFYSIFALLFGMSFAIMMNNAAQKGSNFSGRFIWRLLLLLGFGFIHSLIYRGDILGVYVVIGFILPLFYSVSSRWLLIIAALLFLGAGRFAFFAITGSASLLDYQNIPSDPEILRYTTLLKTGNFFDVARDNLVYFYTGKWDFQFGIFGRGYFTLAYFLVGLWLIRSGFVQNIAQHKALIKKCLWGSLIASLVFIGASVALFAQMSQPVNYSSWPFVMAWNVADLANISLTMLLMCAFVLLYLRKPDSRLSALAPYGRMALTNYITQSLIGTFFLYGWGFGYLGKLHDWQMLLLALVVIYVQVQVSKLWLSYFQYGPLEWLWRCGTWFSRFPFRKIPAERDAVPNA